MRSTEGMAVLVDDLLVQARSFELRSGNGTTTVEVYFGASRSWFEYFSWGVGTDATPRELADLETDIRVRPPERFGAGASFPERTMVWDEARLTIMNHPGAAPSAELAKLVAFFLDLDDDGVLDLAAGNESAISVLLGAGDGSFAAQPDLVPPSGVLGLAAGDLDGDGRDAQRPRIISAPTSVDLNEWFTATTNTAVEEFVLVRMASATHSVNLDQRRIPLSFTDQGNLSYRLHTPDDPGIVIPGAYMLFALDSSGVPSVASIVTVSSDVDPGGGSGSASGTVTDANGSPAGGVDIDLFVANPDGSRGAWLRSTATADDGGFQFTLDAGSYVLTFIAPEGQTFTNGSRWHHTPVSISSGEAVSGLDAMLTGAGNGDGGVSGIVTAENGDPIGGIVVDLFQANADGSRGGWLQSTTTGPDGLYALTTSAGCYVLTFIAPEGLTFTNGSPWYQPSQCVAAGQQVGGIDAVVAGGGGGGQSSIAGTVFRSGNGVAAVAVDLFAASADGSRGAWLAQATTDASGAYSFVVEPGCYVLTFIAPEGLTFTNGSQWYQPSQCVAAAQQVGGIDASLN